MASNKFKDKFRYYLRRSGYTQKELAHKLYVDASTLSKWVNGENRWPEEALFIVCEVLEIVGDDKEELFTLAKELRVPTRPNEPDLQSDLHHSLTPRLLRATRFIGRFTELEQIMNALREPKRKPIVAIIGLGGIGKTALAQEVTEYSVQENLFDHIVWASFKTEYFISETIIKTGQSTYSFDQLLSNIGRQCGQLDIAKMPLEQRQAATKYLLSSKRILIVLDNLETVPDNEKLVADLFKILGKSKVLITSRHHLKNEQIFTLALGGFPEQEGVMFLREDSQARGIEAVIQAGQSDLVEIYQVAGGAPLAMKLVVGQMSRQPMVVVLKMLKDAEFQGQDENFYHFIYQHSWELLDMNAKMALVDMSVFPPITGGAVVDVQSISQVQEAAFWPAMDQLVTMSLVDKTGAVGRERYALHPLTHYFIRSDITKEWAE